MTEMLLNIIVIGVCALAVYYGWHSGGPRQIGPILGWTMAVITVRLAAPALSSWLEVEGFTTYDDGDIAARWLAVLLIYITVVSLVTLITSPLSRMTDLLQSHVMGGIVGALLTLLRWGTLLSILLNLWAATDQDCLALKIASGGDGGIIEGVMHVAPTIMGEDDFEETYIRRQLREAKTISLLRPLYDCGPTPIATSATTRLMS